LSIVAGLFVVYEVNMDEEIKVGARNSRMDQERLQNIHDFVVSAGAECPGIEKHANLDGNALKAISQTEDELRVGNYIIQFGKRDLEGLGSPRINPDGTKGEAFSPDVDVESDYTKTGMLYVDWEHGMDPDGLGADEHSVLGYVDWKTARRDERGIFVERVLNRRNKYMQWLEGLIQDGLISNSSEAVRGVQKTTDGTITRWPLKRDALTVNPMQWQNLSENVMSALKALGVHPSIPAPETGAAPAAAVITPESIQPVEVKTMDLTQEQIDAIANSAATKAVEEYRKSEPATVKAGIAAVTTDAADQPFENDGQFFQAVKTAALFPSREDPRLRSIKAPVGMSEGVPEDGGYLLSNGLSNRILERMYKSGEILPRVAKDPIGPNSNGMTYNALNETSRAAGSRWSGIQGYWLAEAGTMTGTKPKFRQMELKLKKVAALAYATDEQLQDTTNLEAWINRTVPEELRFMTEDAIFEGDGVGKPLGIMNSPCLVTVTRDTATRVLYADIMAMWARRWSGVKDYVWYVNQDVTPQLDQLVLANASDVPTRFLSYDANGVLRMKGAPVIEVEYASSLNTTGDIMLASMSQYQAIDKGGIQTASSIHVQFLTNETAFRFIYRIDGEPIWNSPLTPFKGTATQSPFVVLGSASA
jgi:HK97 family phage major capsid protein